MSSDELKACPFCGEPLKVRITDCSSDGQNTPSNDMYSIGCRQNGHVISTELFHTEAEAITAWNTRAVDPAKEAWKRYALARTWNLADVQSCADAEAALRQLGEIK
jgi:hypothetical protein